MAVLSAVTFTAAVAGAGTECLAPGYCFLGFGASTSVPLFFADVYGNAAMISLSPEVGYFFADNVAFVTAVKYLGYYDFDHGSDGATYVELALGSEIDAPVSPRWAIYMRGMAGAMYGFDYDDEVNPVVQFGGGAKAFVAPQTPFYFGLIYRAAFFKYGGETSINSNVSIDFGLQIVF
ncbi:MAG: hypothetical protein PVH29_08685 [Candidatus Zixiibacteriota bacterium]|jgi:hypothetical protein